MPGETPPNEAIDSPERQYNGRKDTERDQRTTQLACPVALDAGNVKESRYDPPSHIANPRIALFSAVIGRTSKEVHWRVIYRAAKRLNSRDSTYMRSNGVAGKPQDATEGRLRPETDQCSVAETGPMPSPTMPRTA